MRASLERKSAHGELHRKLANARFLLLSLVIHLGLILLGGTIVLFRTIDTPPDFVASTVDSLLTETVELPPDKEQIQEAVPLTDQRIEPPDVSAPTLEVMTTTAQFNNFKISTSIPTPTINYTGEVIKATPALTGIVGARGNFPGVMRGRGSDRGAIMRQGGGKPRSEDAVRRGLDWLVKHQERDGSWGNRNKGAMSGLALLCFLGHGETPESPVYGPTVARAVQWFITEGTKARAHLNMQPSFGQPGVYEHGIATYALGEYYTMTQDARVLELLKQAVAIIVEGQTALGAWDYDYNRGNRNDISVTGWQIQALKAAHLTGLKLPGVDEALDKAVAALNNVFRTADEQGYDYDRNIGKRYNLTGIGNLGHLVWKGERKDVKKSIDWVMEETVRFNSANSLNYRGPESDLYAWYYHTQAALMYGGTVWQKWNRWFQDELCNVQNPDGSWPVPGYTRHYLGDEDMTGQVYRTTLCILMLEVYYRYMPLNKA